NMTPASFRRDVRQSKDALEQATGEAVVGYRAPTFSILRQTGWALDVLAELGMAYDSSVYPVRHDRYGVPEAPRAPVLARGKGQGLLDRPPAALRLLWGNVPMGGGGSFRLFPLCLTEWAIRQAERGGFPRVATLYFHPWEFDPDQPRLPLGLFSRFRTYVGISRSRRRLGRLLSRHRFVRMADAAEAFERELPSLPHFSLARQAAYDPSHRRRRSAT